MNLFHGTVVGLIGLGLAQTAQAQISADSLTAFNQDVETGDAAAIEVATTNLMNEAIANPDDPDALIVAYEAALKLCDIDCAAALPGAEFALGFPATGQHPIMAERELLAAFAGFTAESTRDTRRELLAALNNIQDPTLLSARAFMPLYADLASRDNLGDAAAVAGLAVRKLRPVRSSVLQYYLHAAETHATTSFLEAKTLESHEALVRWNAELRELKASVGSDDAPEWLERAFWRSEAWLGLAGVFYSSTDKNGDGSGRFRRGDVTYLSEDAVAAIYQEYSIPDDFDVVLTGQDVANGLPVCGAIPRASDGLNYPRSALSNGDIGYTILRYDMDEDGYVIDESVRMLAAVPEGVFEEEVIDSLSDWRFRVTGDLRPPECYIQRTNIIHTISFSLR